MKSRSVLTAVVLSLAVLLAGCAQGNDPDTWETAEAQDGFPVKANFIDACEKANTDADGMSASQATSFCECAFGEVRESLTFEEFKQLDDDLRADAESDVPQSFEELVSGCGAADE